MNPKRLFVGNLAYSVNEEELWGLFSRYGEVKGVRIIEGKGYGFVEMDSYDDARKVRNALNETEFKGRNLLIDDIRPPKKRPVFERAGNNPGKTGGYTQKRQQKPEHQGKIKKRKGQHEGDKETGNKRSQSGFGERNYPEKRLKSIQKPDKSGNIKPEKEEKKLINAQEKKDRENKKKVRRLWPGGK